MPTSENKLIKEGRHVGLDFYDLLIEAVEAAAEVTKPLKPSMERVAKATWQACRP
jgi:hypothetical protein